MSYTEHKYIVHMRNLKWLIESIDKYGLIYDEVSGAFHPGGYRNAIQNYSNQRSGISIEASALKYYFYQAVKTLPVASLDITTAISIYVWDRCNPHGCKQSYAERLQHIRLAQQEFLQEFEAKLQYNHPIVVLEPHVFTYIREVTSLKFESECDWLINEEQEEKKENN